MSNNIEITAAELLAVRSFDDFDMKMFLSEINQHGWDVARSLIPMIVAAGKSAGASS